MKNMTEQAQAVVTDADTQAEGKVTQLVYILQAIGFIFGITFLAGVIVNYVKRGELTSDLQKSHFRWQIRTFWFSFLWTVVGGILSFVFIGYFIILANIVWTIFSADQYRLKNSLYLCAEGSIIRIP